MDRILSRFWRRLRNDPPFAILSLMSLFGIIGVAPFIVFRLLDGNYLVAIADAAMVLATIGAVVFAWITHDTAKAGVVLVFIFSIVAFLVSVSLGISGVFWVYPLILINFFLATPRIALPATLGLLTIIAVTALLYPGTIVANNSQLVSFLVTAIMAGTLTHIFASRARTQRQKLESLAIQDPLTGARNRRAMNDDLQTAVARHRRHQQPQALLVMDLDHFKLINDRFGHPAGDQVLVDFVALAKRCSRGTDLLYRFGGEEFLMLLPDTDAHGLRQVAQQLHQRIRRQLVGPGGTVTVSIGGTLLRPDEHWNSWLQRADTCLYQAKDSGRDCIILDSEPAAGEPAMPA
jgi:diguanylate cyclase (GGDEF)-like protein